MKANNSKSPPKKSINIDLNAPKKVKATYIKQLPLEDFVKENHHLLKEYICPLCTGVLVEPIIDSAAHMFCKKCLQVYEKKHISKNKKLICPITNHELNKSTLKPYELINNFLKEMICVCPNKRKGCKWEGKYYLKNQHIEDECNFINEEICPNEGCELRLKSENVNSHLLKCDFRKINCEKCEQLIIYKDKNEHIKECVKESTSCDKCGIKMIREQLEEHQKENCPEIEINCDYLFFGCKDKFLRKNKYFHYIPISQVINHSTITMNWFNGFKNKINNSLSLIQRNIKENRLKINYFKQNLNN